MPTHVAFFVATTWLLAMIPGPGQAVMLRQTIELGVRTARATIAGTCTGLLLWTSAAALGLSAVLLANPTAYTVLRIAGAAVLAVLGVRTLLGMRRNAVAPQAAPNDAAGSRRGPFLLGLATNLGNPKAGVFAVSVLPQFVTPHGPVLLSSLALGALWAGTTASWYVVFTATVDRGRSFVTRPAVHRWTTLAGGTALLVIGAYVAVGA